MAELRNRLANRAEKNTNPGTSIDEQMKMRKQQDLVSLDKDKHIQIHRYIYI